MDRHGAGDPEDLSAALPSDQRNPCCYIIGMCIQHIEIDIFGYGGYYDESGCFP